MATPAFGFEYSVALEPIRINRQRMLQMFRVGASELSSILQSILSPATLQEIQVIAPTYQGPAGVDALNARLQERLNPPSPARNERHFGARIFREGDKVMQVVNSYERSVFNGDIGRITRIDPVERQQSRPGGRD